MLYTWAFRFFRGKNKGYYEKYKNERSNKTEMYFSVPQGTHELTFGILDDEGGELWNFYLIFIESTMMRSRQIIVYADYSEDGISTDMQTLSSNWHEGLDNEFEFEFQISKMKKVTIYMCLTDIKYNIHVTY